MSRQVNRRPEGGRIDRDRSLGFTFNGRRYTGFAGDTLASALLANGVMLVGRSFKFHRPRGIFSCGAEEPNAIVQLGAGARTEPNLRATQIELFEGLEAASVNCWPSVEFDAGAVSDWFSRLMPAGFYYKTFMWPARFWPQYEYVIRHAAGLGRAPAEKDPDRYEKFHVHCDVLVAGGGPAGLAAAFAAGRSGARVILADEHSEFGGALLGLGAGIGGKPAIEWVESTVGKLRGMAEVRLLPRSTVFGYYDHNDLGIAERVTDHLGPAAPPGPPRQRLWKVRAKQVVLAAGAHERPLVFADNDRPGVMLASAAQAYVNRYAVRPGERAVVVTNNDSAYQVALDLDDAGVKVAALVDLRPAPEGPLADALRDRGIDVLGGRAVVATSGGRRVDAVEVGRLNDDADRIVGGTRRINCDLVCVSGGWNPAVHLFSQSRGKLRFDAAGACFTPGDSYQAERSAGACNGAFRLADCLAQGLAAGAAAARDAGFRKGRAPAAPKAPEPEAAPLRAVWRIPLPGDRARGAKQFVDLQHDVTAADVALAAREGYAAVEHLKRYTTTGMGTDQGKTSNVNALGILGQVTGTDIAGVGATTFRPPYTPVGYGLLAGRDVDHLFDPARRTPMHAWHESVGAVFEDVGQWKRAWYYPRGAESMRAAVDRECLAVRNSVGIVDASTLGKIDVQGADALELLNRVYTNAWDTLKPGRCRYGLMLGEDGMLFDDGVTSCLGENHYHMTTTTGGAERVLAWLEQWLQTEWPRLKVYLTSVTTHWAVAAIQGPNARRLLAELCDDVDLGAFPFMSWRDGTVAGIPARIFRVSFSGELSYEINVPSSLGVALWQALMTAGARYGITPYGTEAMLVLRAEKGYVVVGHDTDGTVTPQDLGMDWIVSKKKKDFLGKRSFARSDTARPDRKHLVGLLTEDPREVVPEGSQIVEEVRPAPPMPMGGHVTSSYWSAALGRSIAMALLVNGRNRHGETVTISLPDRNVRAAVTKPVFYDPEGEKLRA
ncbi:MAG: sarcosine oxidase subunit alpha family protein [Proteobacteria bacterium]|nr:sarcosine oxidase subunit alpha family protein [Pseudomonadota bacterium]